MDEEVLKNCKKFIIQRIINPSVYWMTEFDKGKYYKRQLKEFECLLSKNVQKVKEKEEIPLGTMVAVQDQTNFQRGIITDIFTRRFRVIYLINLVDYGKTIEATAKNMYYITNKQLRHTQFSAYEITIDGIQPTVLDVDYEKTSGNGIFQKRVSQTWSLAAFHFVKDLITRNPFVFVKPLHTNQGKISGEIYFLQEPDKEVVSLGQLLCDRGFATVSTSEAKLKDGLQGEDKMSIEDKIPKNALFKGFQESSAAETLMEAYKRKCEAQNSSKSKQKAFNTQSIHSSLSSNETELGSGNLKSSSSTLKSDSDFYSPSWMLKKCLQLYPWSSSDNSTKKQDI